ncbi:DEKNAAC104413 [Brettanomyces naardenensis]|uniref:Protein-lysine N-methyltransferase EFM4 n=1 Tax=Brettanomyces naardenensis TaxID=13370 RepID=A0A448YR16_BRENA|nr:DEKNAAC104413 [Brettanomyces naardenensis]
MSHTSILGTKKHWDAVYSKEHILYNQTKDIGECWYDDADAEDKIAHFILTHFGPGKTGGLCDLGTGNGHLLFKLSQLGLHNSAMVGIDYSSASVSFAKDVVSKGPDLEGIHFYQSDFLRNDDTFLGNHSGKFGLIIDKGTLDAIFLSKEKYQGLTGVEVYPHKVASMMKRNGVLLVTACNFTADELIDAVTKTGELEYWTRLEYPVFEFGGRKGSKVCTVGFRRRD